MTCEYCVDISELEIDYPDDPWHGGIRYCENCGSIYFEEYGGRITGNEEAIKNHPNLKLT